MKKILITLLVWLALLSIPGIVKNSFAECTGLSISPSTAKAGDSVTVIVFGCSQPASNYKLNLIGANSSQSFDVSNIGGQYGATFTFPPNFGSGNFQIQLLDKATASPIPGVSGQVQITAAPNNGNVGTGISINGNCGSNYINTAIGCVPINDQNALIGFFLKWGIGIGGGIAFLLILVAGFQIISSRGDPNRLKAGQELMTSAIAGLLLLIFSLVILNIIGFKIFNITAFQ